MRRPRGSSASVSIRINRRHYRIKWRYLPAVMRASPAADLKAYVGLCCKQTSVMTETKSRPIHNDWQVNQVTLERSQQNVFYNISNIFPTENDVHDKRFNFRNLSPCRGGSSNSVWREHFRVPFPILPCPPPRPFHMD